MTGDPPQVAGWHYQRQMEVVTADDAPSGKRYVRFHNAEAGRGAQALQVFAVDGRYVRQLELSLRARFSNVQPDPALPQPPLVYVQFYDENRTPIGDQMVGSLRGSSGWKTEAKKMTVPVRAREALDSHRAVWGHGRPVAG